MKKPKLNKWLVLHFIYLFFLAVVKFKKKKKFLQSYLTSFAMDIFQWDTQRTVQKIRDFFS